MEVVFWIGAAIALLALLAYGAIGVTLLLAKYRMAHARNAKRAVAASAGIVDLRYRAP